MKTTARVLILVLICAVGFAGPLKIATVKFPDINCKFDTDCTITVSDKATNFTLPGATGAAFLQSRLWPKGQAGTPGANLYAYLYRIDVRQPAAVTNVPCVTSMTIDFGPIKSMDYDGDGQLDQVFVATQGGLGTIAPVSATQVGTKVTLVFSPGVCAGAMPGGGKSSYFIGMTSKQPHRTIDANLKTNTGATLILAAYAPLAAPPPAPTNVPSSRRPPQSSTQGKR